MIPYPRMACRYREDNAHHALEVGEGLWLDVIEVGKEARQ